MWFLALRHLTSRKRQTFLTLLGILLGTAAYVVISGLLIGFQEFIVNQLVDNDAHVKIAAREEILTPDSLDAAFFGDDAVVSWIKAPTGRKDNPFIVSPGTWMQRLERDPKVEGAAAHMEVQVIANRGKVTSTARLLGADPEQQQKVSNIGRYMVSGKITDIGTSGNRVIVGKELLDTLGAAHGETIYLSAGKGAPQAFRVVGVFRIGVRSVDESTIIGALGDAQKLNQTPSRVTSIAVRLKDVREARAVASSWDLLGEEKVQSWDQANQGLMSVFSMQDIVRNAMTISILIVASFGIYNILSLAISHKKKEIAILRSMGFEPRDISRLFLTQGVILGGAGGFVGLSLGLLICLYLGSINLSSNSGLGMGGEKLFMSFSPAIYLKAFLLAAASACIASLLPARAAGRLEPIDIMRSESE
jgi:lipoprotein-releasing system permease protein